MACFHTDYKKCWPKKSLKDHFLIRLLTIERLTGVKIGKRQAIALVKQCASDFDAFYQQPFLTACSDEIASLPIMVLTTDGKGIVMRSNSLREGTRKRQQNTNHKLKHRLSKGEKQNRKRMAQVASIYFIARFVRKPEDIISDFGRQQIRQTRPRPLNKRIWASVEKDSSVVLLELFDEAHRRDPTHCKEWVVLVDGQKYQLNEIKKMAKKRNLKITIILDIIHVIEELKDAAHLFFDESSQSCEDWVSTKRLDILNSKGQKIAGSIRMSAAKRNYSFKQRQQAETCASVLPTRNHIWTIKLIYLKAIQLGLGLLREPVDF